MSRGLVLAVMAIVAVFVLGSCGPRGESHELPPAPRTNPPGQQTPGAKAEPPAKTLIVQPTSQTSETDWANDMTIAVDGSKSAAFSFDYFPQTTGSLTFDTASQFRIEPVDCREAGGRSHRFDLTWSRVFDDGHLEKLTGYTVYLNRYSYTAGLHYRLTYTIEEFDESFADCHSVRIRFALQETKPD